MRKPDFAVTPGGVPILRPQEIESYAQSLIGEFSPPLLQMPAALNLISFVRRYVGCRLAVIPLCGDGSIRAQTHFREIFLEYRDEAGFHRLRVPEGTILVDRSLLAAPREGRFCIAHELGHFLLHAECYRAGTAALTPEERDTLERQADIFAYALLMNAPTLTAYWGSMQTQLNHLYGENADLANHYAAAVFANHYRVSRKCSAERLRQLGLWRRSVEKGGLSE